MDKILEFYFPDITLTLYFNSFMLKLFLENVGDILAGVDRIEVLYLKLKT